MNPKEFIEEIISKYPRAIIISSCLILIILAIMLSVLKYDNINNIINDNQFNFILVTSITFTVIIFTINVSFLKITKAINIDIEVDGDEKRSYSPVFDDLRLALNKASSQNKILNVQVTNLGVKLNTQQKSTNYDAYVRYIDDGIRDGNIFCQFLFLAFDKKSAERIIREAKNFEGYESYEIKVILGKAAPLLPIYNIYVFGEYAAKLSIENPSNHIITIHSNNNKDKNSIVRIQKLFNHGWSIDGAQFLLKNGVVVEHTLSKLNSEYIK